MKTCFKCKRELPLSEFYRHAQMGDGYLGKCKDCTKRDVADRIELKKHDPDWVMKERERCRDKQNAYRAIPGYVAPKAQAAFKKWARLNPHKRHAHSKADFAKRSGNLVAPLTCERCGVSGVKLDMHHADYSKPLSVQWLCKSCHGFVHRKPDPRLVSL